MLVKSCLLTLIVTGAFAFAACTNSQPSAGGAKPPESGVDGLVQIGPVSPVAKVGQTSTNVPFAAEIAVRLPTNRQELLRVRSGEDGKFRIDLAPGNYELVPISPKPGAPPYAEPQIVSVTAGQYISVTILYDSGIR